MIENTWNDANITKLKRIMITDPFTNECLNLDECADSFGITLTTMRRRIYEMRRNGQLPQFKPTEYHDAYQRPYTEREIKTIAAMLNAGRTTIEVADQMERTKKGIEFLRIKLVDQGRVAPVCKRWSAAEDQFILENIQLDKNGICVNTAWLAHELVRARSGVEHRLTKLRKQHKLPKPTRRGASDPGIEIWLDFKKKWLKQTFKRW
jgi:hypothetical protein